MKALRKVNKNGRKRTQKKKPSYLIRLAKEWNEWNEIPGVVITLHDPMVIDKFTVSVLPQSGFWKGAKFKFKFDVGEEYPIEPPQVRCLTTPIYHPNIDTAGHVCLNLLREDWMPVNTIENIVYGLITLFENPNYNDPLPSNDLSNNMQPSEVWRRGVSEFKKLVRNTLRGGKIDALGKDHCFPILIT